MLDRMLLPASKFQNRPPKRQCRRDAAFSGTGAVYTKPRFEHKKSGYFLKKFLLVRREELPRAI
jgi:hypothetical protein